ncbi:iron ABC transporter permease [Pontibacillus halophilus JSM 076056 = DSM 19796]|uniref:Iron ABC transporter permease n=1 Tax=Pontibacillus halophilus JSM 076056 = DSM 19796 TaxID=1385510 RepID=A0A0A5GD45_9BACI|nr:ABC transporter permease [Pontibacillus halophilus]KGX91136.1 iron ABC transporter permease [Pontibacillus halophilus JSM 076056 = DSM 19796]
MKIAVQVSLLLILSVLSLFVGVSNVGLFDLFQLTDQQQQVFWVSRIPRLVSILIAGMSISIVGFIMQQLSRNKFVSPTTAGTMDSARLGILVALILFPSASMLTKMGIGFLFALIGTFLFMKILGRIRFKDAIFIPLVGLMLGNVIGSITTFIAYKYDLIQSIGSWLSGDFSMIVRGRYELLYLSIPALLIAYIYANRFTIAGMGEDFAMNLGLNYKGVVNIGLVIVAFVSSTVLLTVGTLPFLGLIIPNIVSIYAGDHLKNSLIHTALLGALFVLLCDLLGRVIIFPYEISIGLTVGVIGSGIFLVLLLRRAAYE